MRMLMLFLVCALVQLVGSNPVSHHRTLHHLLTEIEKYQSRLPSKPIIYLEAVTDLSDHCNANFFCKVEEILEKNKQILHAHEANKMHVTLKQYIIEKNLNCTEELKDVTPSQVEEIAFDFLDKVKSCIQRVNHRGQ